MKILYAEVPRSAELSTMQACATQLATTLRAKAADVVHSLACIG